MDHWPLQWFMTYWISKLSKTPYTQQQKLYDSICCMNCNLTFPFNKFQTKKRQLGELLVVYPQVTYTCSAVIKLQTSPSVQSNLKNFQSCFLDLRHDHVELQGLKNCHNNHENVCKWHRPWHEYCTQGLGSSSSFASSHHQSHPTPH